MNYSHASKIEEAIFHPHHHHQHHLELGTHHPHQQHELDPHEAQSQPSILIHQDDDDNDEAFLFRDDNDDDDVSHTSSDAENPLHSQPQFPQNDAVPSNPNPNLSIPTPTNNNEQHHPPLAYVSPEPHISSQFYTFNKESHALMIHCLREGRLATTDEIRVATPQAVLASWRSVWKDRNRDTAYLTAWKRIQDKLISHVDTVNGNEFLCFKNNSNQFVSHVDQWQDIVMSFHSNADLKHLGLKESIEKIKQVWTVGAKFYGIPESYIRSCISACPVCSDESSGASALRTKRRRFEYTESIEVPAKEVPVRLQQLAAKHKVVLCIRQKYIRYKPIMVEVKDYACHRAGDPASSVKKAKILKREPYASKRCGCGFRIRAIVPISNYNEKDKTFVYEEEGVAVFKLYAVHSGHEPGPLDGNARIIHRIVGHKDGFLMDQDTIYGVGEETENDSFGFQHSVMQQVEELRNEVGYLEGRIGKIPSELLSNVSRELIDLVNKVRNIGEYSSKSVEHQNDVLVGENDLAEWTDHHHRISAELIEEDDEDSFGRTLGEVASWEQMRSEKENCKHVKSWLKYDLTDSKLNKSSRHDVTLEDTDVSLSGIPEDAFYPDNPKWFDSPTNLDSCGFKHV